MHILQVNLSGNECGPEGAKALAPAIRATASLTSINLSDNNLTNYGRDMTGIKAIADALVEASITSVGKDGLNLKDNYFGPEGWGAIFAAICSSQVSNITSVDASGENIGPEGAKLIGQALGNSVNPSMTSIDLRDNGFGPEGAKALAPALRDSPSMTSINLQANALGPEAVKALAPVIRDSTSVTSVRAFRSS